MYYSFIIMDFAVLCARIFQALLADISKADCGKSLCTNLQRRTQIERRGVAWPNQRGLPKNVGMCALDLHFRNLGRNPQTGQSIRSPIFRLMVKTLESQGL
jgi:hypothetical protein